jgi:hypothetical protein
MSTTAQAAGPRPGLEALTGLVDDAAIFPPAEATMTDALRGHGEHRGAWYAPLVGGFVCSDTRLPDLQNALDATSTQQDRLYVNLTISGGAGAVEPALTWLGRDQRLALSAVEVALRDEDDLARNAVRMTTVLAGSLPDDVPAYVEMPRLHGADAPAGWTGALDELAAAGVRLKYRTGGLDAGAFPSCAELAALVGAALDREVEFKLTAGLHHAVCHTDPETGFEHHGFLNVLLATRACLDGATADEVAGRLNLRDPEAVAGQVADMGAAGVASTRRWFTSFGTCSVSEPVDDLVRLGLIGEG